MLENNEYLESIQNVCLYDDAYMELFFRDKAAVQTLVQVLMNDTTLQVETVKTQHAIKTISEARTVRLDILAYDKNGTAYNIEIQKNRQGASPHRARYYSGMLDLENLKHGQEFNALPNTYVIFITKEDYFGYNKSIYHIERMNTTIGIPFNDGAHIMYVNGQYSGEDNIGKLMHDFRAVNPEQMYFNTFRKRAHFLKKEDEGVKEMSSVMEEFRNKALAEGEAKGKFESLKAVAQKMLSRKTYSNEEIAEISGLPLAVIQKLAEQMV